MSKSAAPITAIAIPVHNEAALIAACLESLDNQVGAQPDHIVLLANNCTDATVPIARAVTMQRGTTLHVIEMNLPPEESSAGHARRLAMQCAAALAGKHGVLLTTDADARVDPEWLAANLAALEAGADVVCGWVELDPIDWGNIPSILHEDDARECAYDSLCDTLHARLDPDPDDPLPRHTQHSGASIALTAVIFARCGGVPDVPSGEDRALIAALRRVDARIRHAPEVHVVVSGRIDGRSKGGMADTIRRRLAGPDAYLDDRLEPAADCARRAASRRQLRAVLESGEGAAALAAQLEFDGARLEALLRMSLGAAWYEVEAESPVLRRRRVAVGDLPAEVQAAEAILSALDRGDQCDNPVFATQIQE
jgi:hypothetical protein